MSAAATAASADSEENSAASLVECNICLDTSREPVVTRCGHLYCWSCLYRWMRNGHNVCPVCKAGVSRETVIPLYGRGSGRSESSRPHSEADRPAAPTDGSPGDGASDSNSGSEADGGVPSRPAAQRMEPPQQHHGQQQGDPWGAWTGGGPGGGGGGNVAAFTVGYGFFPSLFGLQFQAVGPGVGHRAGGAPQSREEQQQQLVARALFALGVAMVLMLLLL